METWETSAVSAVTKFRFYPVERGIMVIYIYGYNVQSTIGMALVSAII